MSIGKQRCGKCKRKVRKIRSKNKQWLIRYNSMRPSSALGFKHWRKFASNYFFKSHRIQANITFAV